MNTFSALNMTLRMIEYYRKAEKINPNHPTVKKYTADINEFERLREDTIKDYSKIKDMALEELKKEKNKE